MFKDGYLKEIDNVFTVEECKTLINKAERLGFTKASFNDSINTDIRKSSRIIIPDSILANDLYDRINEYIPVSFKGYNFSHINPYFRFLKYTKGDEFKPHTDGEYREGNKVSKFTLLIYLNEEYKGGYTSISLGENLKSWFSIVPKYGKVIIQEQSILHAVFPLQEGTKYVIRTDIMYSL